MGTAGRLLHGREGRRATDLEPPKHGAGLGSISRAAREPDCPSLHPRAGCYRQLSDYANLLCEGKPTAAGLSWETQEEQRCRSLPLISWELPVQTTFLHILGIATATNCKFLYFFFLSNHKGICGLKMRIRKESTLNSLPHFGILYHDNFRR